MPPKVKLSPEEKKALRAQKRQEKKLAKIEKKKQLKRDVLSREIQYSNLTMKRHEREWKQLLINIALPHIRDDLEFAWHNFERVIDCKDFSISLLMDELQEAEEHYILNCKNHVENIDKLIDMYRERMEEMFQQNEQNLANLQSESEKEVERIKSEFSEEETTLKTMCYMLELARKQQNQNFRAEYHSKLDEEQSKNDQNLQRLKGILEIDLAGTYDSMKHFLSNHRNRTAQRKKDHDYLTKKDCAMQKVIKKQTDNLHLAYETTNNLQMKMNNLQKLLGRREKNLESEYDFFFLAFGVLKNNLVEDRKLDFKKINFLTSCYNESIETLEQLRSKCELLLSVAAVCRKLETQEEKVMPFPTHIFKHDIEYVIVDKNVKDYIEQLDLFFQKVGQADAMRYAIQEEKDFLIQENEILKTKLHRYCHCLNCPVADKKITVTTKHVTEGVDEYMKYMKQRVPQFLGKKHPEDETKEDDDEDDEDDDYTNPKYLINTVDSEDDWNQNTQ